MATTIKKFNIDGKEIGQVNVPEDLLKAEANGQSIKDYLVAIRANQRQWSANTKTRAEVNHSTKKPHPQKGTGRARQGFLGAPQFRGGGRVGGPRPKFDQHVRINKKERRAAIRYLLVEKILAGRLIVLEAPQMDEPKTKIVANFMKNSGMGQRRTLFVAPAAAKGAKKDKMPLTPREENETFAKSLRNLPKTSFQFLPNMSGYDAAINENLVVMNGAIDELLVFLKG